MVRYLLPESTALSDSQRISAEEWAAAAKATKNCFLEQISPFLDPCQIIYILYCGDFFGRSSPRLCFGYRGMFGSGILFPAFISEEFRPFLHS